MELAQIARDALVQARPLVKALMASNTVTRRHLYIEVSKRVTPDETGLVPVLSPTVVVLASDTYGDPTDWEHNYPAIAQGKRNISVRTGLPSREVQTLRHELLEDKDVTYCGSVVLGDIIIAASGVQDWYDEAIADIVRALILAAIRQEREPVRRDRQRDYYNA